MARTVHRIQGFRENVNKYVANQKKTNIVLQTPPEGFPAELQPARKKIVNLLYEAEKDLLGRLHPHRDIILLSSIIFMILGFVLILLGMIICEDRYHFREEFAALSLPVYVYVNIYHALFISSIVLLSLASVGFIASWRENLRWLRFYQNFINIMIALVILVIIAVAMAMNIFKLSTMDAIGHFLINDYTESARIQKIIDDLQTTHHCCGITAWDNWNSNRYFRCVDDNPSIDKCAVPRSCCKNNTENMSDVLNDNVRRIIDPAKRCNWAVLNKTKERAFETINVQPCVKYMTSTVDSICRNLLYACSTLLIVFVLLGFSTRELSKGIRSIVAWARRIEEYLAAQEKASLKYIEGE